MSSLPKMLFVLALVLAGACVAVVLRDPSPAAVAVAAPVVTGGGDARVAPVAAPLAAVAADGRQPVAATPAVGDIAPFSSPAEKEQTRERREAALPVFLQAADAAIAALEQDLARARTQGLDGVADMEVRLQEMRRVRAQVLVRNDDIGNR